MKKVFVAKVRELTTGCLGITIPSEIVKKILLKDQDICTFTIEKDEESKLILTAKPTKK